jgi:hypothetical protein
LHPLESAAFARRTPEADISYPLSVYPLGTYDAHGMADCCPRSTREVTNSRISGRRRTVSMDLSGGYMNLFGRK